MNLTSCDIHVALGVVGGMFFGVILIVVLMEMRYFRHRERTLDNIPESMILDRTNEIAFRHSRETERKVWRERMDARRRNRKPKRK